MEDQVQGACPHGDLAVEITRLRDELAKLTAEKPRWTERFGPVVACDHAELLARVRADLGWIWRETTDENARQRADQALTALKEAGIE